MDPNAILKQQLEIAEEIKKIWDDCNGDGTLTKSQMEIVSDHANQLAELVLDLNTWITKGGFLPEAWREV